MPSLLTMMVSATVAAVVPGATQTVAAQPAVNGQAPAPADPDKKVCRHEEELGSIISRRVCHTAAEWHRIDEQTAADAAGALDRRARMGSSNQ